MSEQKFFVQVEDRAKLELALTSESEEFMLSGEVRKRSDPDKPFKKWDHVQLANKTVKLTLRSPERYVVLVDAAFTGEPAEVLLEATIRRENGDIHSEPWKTTISGQEGEVDDRVINILTKK